MDRGFSRDVGYGAKEMRLDFETERAAEQETPHLTTREAEILELVARGYSNSKVADTLILSKRTIDFHLAHAYRKLGACNRVQALLAASRFGLLSPRRTPDPFVGRQKVNLV